MKSRQHFQEKNYFQDHGPVGLTVSEVVFFLVFPTISLWELYVVMATREPLQSAQNIRSLSLTINALHEI